jgi:hypothetical protein
MEQVKVVEQAKVQLKTEKAKTIVKCLANETEFINSDDFFDKYQNELEKVGIKKGKSCSSCLSMATLKPIIKKKEKAVEKGDTCKKLQHYLLKENYNDLIEEN